MKNNDSTFLKYYKNAPDLNLAANSGRKPKRAKNTYAVVAINLGDSQGIGAAQLVRMISKNPAFKTADIGDIKVENDISYFEIEPDYLPKMLEEKFSHRGETLLVEHIEDESKRPPAKERRSGGGGRGDRRGSGGRSGGGYRGGRRNDRRSGGGSRDRGGDRRRSGGSRDGGNRGGERRNRRDSRR